MLRRLGVSIVVSFAAVGAAAKCPHERGPVKVGADNGTKMTAFGEQVKEQEQTFCKGGVKLRNPN